MFDSVPDSYNLLNKILTAGKDQIWRNKVLEILEVYHGDRILDICTGTGDLALKMAERFTHAKIYAIDFSFNMLNYAKNRAKDTNMQNVIFMECDCNRIGFRSNCFNYITISFGFRNLSYSYENLIKSLKEIYRVLKNKGKLIILETSQPVNSFIKGSFHFYASRIVPKIGSFFSGQRYPYAYLGGSIVRFFSKDELNDILATEGFRQHRIIPFMFGAILLSVFQKESF